MMNYRMVTLGAVATTLFALYSPAFAFPDKEAKETKEATHDGKVVSITDAKLVMTAKGGKAAKEHSHKLAKDAKLTLDGKECKAEDIKAGMKIRVTTKTGLLKIATHIDAIDKNEMFSNTHDGKLISIKEGKLVMTDKDDKEHSHAVSADAKVTCDGKVCKASDLKAEMKIRVTTKRSDEGVAVEIEALDKDPEFAQLD